MLLVFICSITVFLSTKRHITNTLFFEIIYINNRSVNAENPPLCTNLHIRGDSINLAYDFDYSRADSTNAKYFTSCRIIYRQRTKYSSCHCPPMVSIVNCSFSVTFSTSSKISFGQLWQLRILMRIMAVIC